MYLSIRGTNPDVYELSIQKVRAAAHLALVLSNRLNRKGLNPTLQLINIPMQLHFHLQQQNGIHEMVFSFCESTYKSGVFKRKYPWSNSGNPGKSHTVRLRPGHSFMRSPNLKGFGETIQIELSVLWCPSPGVAYRTGRVKVLVGKHADYARISGFEEALLTGKEAVIDLRSTNTKRPAEELVLEPSFS